mmetsp:Transcript_19536/g.49452  ORF Transcript_19536/g.49452 Transcript_19536/m.49452 type:complete len:697 (-) Transcript_19536:113-2203(-)
MGISSTSVLETVATTWDEAVSSALCAEGCEEGEPRQPCQGSVATSPRSAAAKSLGAPPADGRFGSDDAAAPEAAGQCEVSGPSSSFAPSVEDRRHSTRSRNKVPSPGRPVACCPEQTYVLCKSSPRRSVLQWLGSRGWLDDAISAEQEACSHCVHATERWLERGAVRFGRMLDVRTRARPTSKIDPLSCGWDWACACTSKAVADGPLSSTTLVPTDTEDGGTDVEELECPSDADGLEVPRPLSPGVPIPLLDLAGSDRGRLVEAMLRCGAVFVATDLSDDARGPSPLRIPVPRYEKWRQALEKAQQDPHTFYARQCVYDRHLRLSWREDLQRSRDGPSKDFVPDDRVMFGLSDSAVHDPWLEWGDLRWVVDEYCKSKDALASLMQRELEGHCLCETQPRSFGLKLRKGKERWSQSVLRQCFYWDGGSCTEHTDYGVVTMQDCSSAGLEGFIDGAWQPIQPPPGCMVIFAGDMLERLTNGRVQALLHRVVIKPDQPSDDECMEPCTRKGGVHRVRLKGNARKPNLACRQSHVIFLQPDNDSVIVPLARFRSSDGRSDLPPVRYGSWHREKVNLAFGHTATPRYGGRGRGHASSCTGGDVAWQAAPWSDGTGAADNASGCAGGHVADWSSAVGAARHSKRGRGARAPSTKAGRAQPAPAAGVATAEWRPKPKPKPPPPPRLLLPVAPSANEEAKLRWQ